MHGREGGKDFLLPNASEPATISVEEKKNNSGKNQNATILALLSSVQ